MAVFNAKNMTSTEPRQNITLIVENLTTKNFTTFIVSLTSSHKIVTTENVVSYDLTSRENVTSRPAVSGMVQYVNGGLMSQETYMKVQHVLDYVICILLAAGLITNVMNVVVMTRPHMRNPASQYLVSISIVQLVYIVLEAVQVVYRMFIADIFADFFFLTYITYVAVYGETCLERAQYVIHCLVCTERLLAVVLPLKAKNYVIVTRPVLFVVVTCVVVFVGHIHVALKYEVVAVNRNNSTLPLRRFTPIYQNHVDLMEALLVTVKVVFVYAALLYLLLANTAMIVVLVRHAARRRQMKTNVDKEAMRRRNTQMAVTILVSTLVFVFLCLPRVTNALTFDLMPQTYGPFTPQIWLFTFLQNLGGMFFALALSTDFLSYLALSTAYRNTLASMFQRARGKRDAQRSSATNTTAASDGLSTTKYSSVSG